MNRASAIVVLAVSLFVAFPAAGADWMSYGSYEPDTVLDTSTYMWQDRPGVIKDRIYFNGFTTSGPGAGGANGEVVNPNVGMLKTNVDPQGDAAFEAVLGVWTDCNQDGYIGMLETAVREYDARLLVNDDLCPPVAMPPGVGNVNVWVQGANNYRGWVTELIPILHKASGDARTYVDPTVMVWADPGKPDDPAPSPGIVCQARARGDSQTTGGIIHQLDCQGHGIGVRAQQGAIGFDTGDIIRIPIVETFDTAAAGTGLEFGDDPASSESPLNQPTFGSDESQHSAVFLQDCNADPILVTGDVPVGADLDNKVILRPVPATIVNPDTNSWTVPGTLNYTTESFPLPEDSTATETRSTSNCDFTDDSGQDFYRNLEGNVDIPANDGKDAAFSNFVVDANQRGSLPANVYPAGSGVGISNGIGKGGVPTDFGIDALGVNCGDSACPQGVWQGALITYNSALLETRFTIEDPAGTSADLPKAKWWTFYARVGTAMANFDTPGGATGEYGGIQCAGFDAGEHNGWNCAAAAWYLRSDGSYPPLADNIGDRAVVGDTYNLRDVDCWDGQVMPGVGSAAAFYGPAPCER